jgi:hypothetical protein
MAVIALRRITVETLSVAHAPRREDIVFMFISLAFATDGASATQTQPVQELEGSWDLACNDASITVQIGLVALLGGAPIALDEDLVIDVTCGLDGPDVVGMARDLYATCRGTGIPHGPCRDLTRDVKDAVLAVSDAVSPIGLALDVQEWDALGQWTGLYPGTAVATFADGREDRWPVLVDNNTASRGMWAGFGIGVLADETGNLGCVAVGVATASGRVDPVADSATLGVDAGASLICAADLGGGDVLAGDVAIAVNVDAGPA